MWFCVGFEYLLRAGDFHVPRLLHKHGNKFFDAGWQSVNGHEVQPIKPLFSRQC